MRYLREWRLGGILVRVPSSKAAKHGAGLPTPGSGQFARNYSLKRKDQKTSVTRKEAREFRKQNTKENKDYLKSMGIDEKPVTRKEAREFRKKNTKENKDYLRSMGVEE